MPATMLSGRRTMENEFLSVTIQANGALEIRDKRSGRVLRDQGTYLSGRALSQPPDFFVGAVENPFAPPVELRPYRLQKKVEAGAEFIQTQCVFNLEKFAKFMREVRKKGLHKRVHILAGVTPVKSAGMARYMRDKVAGMDVPDAVIDRVAKLKGEEARAEGIRICVETIQKLRKMEGVAGVHIMAIEWEEAVPAIVEQAGLLPRP